MTNNTGHLFPSKGVERSQKIPDPNAPTGDWCRAIEALPITDRTLKLMLHVIARSCGRDGTTTYLRKVDLAYGVGVTERQVTRLRTKARELGYLSWQARGSRQKRLNDRLQLHVEPLTREQFKALVDQALEDRKPVRTNPFSGVPAGHAGSPVAQQDISNQQQDISEISNRTSEPQQQDAQDVLGVTRSESPPSFTSEDHRAPAGAQGEGSDEVAPAGQRPTATAPTAGGPQTSPDPTGHPRGPVAHQDMPREGMDDDTEFAAG